MTSSPRRLGAVLAALVLAAAACTGSGEPEPATSTTSTGAPPTTTTTPEASATTSTAPVPLPDGPVVLAYGTEPGMTVAYDHDATFRINASGDIDPEDVTVTIRGERTFAYFPGMVETALDPTRIEVSGVVGIEERDAAGTGRDALQAAAHDPTLVELPTVLDIDTGRVAGGRTPVPAGLIDPFGLAAALDALPPPELPSGAVAAGDEWALQQIALPLIGPGLVAPASGTARLAGFERDGGNIVAEVVSELSIGPAAAGFDVIATAVLGLGAAERRQAGVEARLDVPLLAEDQAAAAGAGRLEVVSGTITATHRLRLDDGIVVGATIDGELTVAATFVDRGTEIDGAYVVGATATSELDRVSDTPPPLDLDPDDLALEAFPTEIAGYAYEDGAPEAADAILAAVGLLLDGPLVGVGGVRAVRSTDEAAVDVLAFLPAGGVRGDPGLVQAVADVVSGGLDEGDDVTFVSGAPVVRLAVDGGTWWVWQSNTRLLIAAGAEEAAIEVLEALIPWNRAEYLWQPGDCLEFGTGDSFDPPFSPFGDDNLVPCYRPHTLEVVATTVQDEGPEAPFPDDMRVRSDVFCGAAFLDFTGALALDTVLAELRYLPDDLEWEEGDRYLGCTISDVDGDGNVVHATGSLRGTGPARPLELSPGLCRDGSLTSEPVDCDTAHVLESIGSITLPDAPDAPFPGHDELRDQADALCQELLEDYAGTLAVDDVELEAFVTVVDAHLWEIGHRDLPCLARAADRDGNSQRVAGSFASTWVPLGTDDGVTA